MMEKVNAIIFSIFKLRRNEGRKFLIMAFLMFCILLNQNILRNIKDSWVVTVIGAEIITFIKLWIEVPAGAVFLFFYSRLCNKINLFWVFRIIILLFLFYLTIFLFILIPYIENIQPSQKIVDQIILFAPYTKWFLIIISKWVIVSFYVIGELWPIIFYCILFWQLANSITSSEQAQRFYPALGFFGQSNLIFSSIIITYFTSDKFFLQKYFSIHNLHEETNSRIKCLLFLSIVLCIISLLLHILIEKDLKKNPTVYSISKDKFLPLKLGFRESIKLVISSKYLLSVSLIVVSYSLSINLLEGILLSKISQYYKGVTKDVMNYNALITLYIGCFTLFFNFFGNRVITKFGWLVSSILTPISTLVFGSLFFISTIFSEYLVNNKSYILLISIIIGGIHIVITKSIKYSFFDSSKEMAYLTMNNELKVKGKGAIEIFGTKIGKASGSLIQNILFIVFPYSTYDDIKILLFIMFVVVMMVWIRSVITINFYYKKSKINK